MTADAVVLPGASSGSRSQRSPAPAQGLVGVAGIGYRNLSRRAVLRNHHGRLRRRRHQDRAAQGRRFAAQVRHALAVRRYVYVDERGAQQALRHAGPAHPGGRGAVQGAGARVRCGAGELPARHPGEMGAGLRRPVRTEPRPDPAARKRLWAGWAQARRAGVRPHRACLRRPGAPGRRAGRPASRAGLDLAGGLYLGAVGRHRRADGAAGAQPHRPGPGRRYRPVRVRVPPAGRTRARVRGHRLRAAPVGRGRSERRAAQPLPDPLRPMGGDCVQQRPDVRAPGQRDGRARAGRRRQIRHRRGPGGKPAGHQCAGGGVERALRSASLARSLPQRGRAVFEGVLDRGHLPGRAIPGAREPDGSR
ncbi:Uncharacterised protein [Bordetella pertussis]|nr:Uncharacterised protein [Bordetella pertussis]CFP13117.1 Uncharacterised protein [Bordetella pertussis]CFW64127.1 Uncharacterised protein [Bordetella pertussis]CPK10169.1 Uncharacterised protein [Bordetella pertussis]CPO06863.1 Uncharacterised protein [Bordetella pertussis]